jgi:anti-sigma factor RsiW
MESLTMHDLTAAYALGALDATESRQYEDHLATCEVCREQLAELGEAASALAFAVESPAPPEALRGRILERARAERPNVVPLRSRRTVAISAIAAVAAVAAIGLGIWSASLSSSLDRERSARQSVERLLADPTNTRVGVSGTNTGTLFVGRDDKATLVVSGLERAPSGRTYEAWVIKDNKPVRAGTFAGGRTTTVVPLEHQVPSGAIVAVTLEREPGADAPHGKILLHSESA